MSGDPDHQTFGERLVGVSFNPSKIPEVDLVKNRFADAIDEANRVREDTSDLELGRIADAAINASIEACMWTVKALTWKQ